MNAKRCLRTLVCLTVVLGLLLGTLSAQAASTVTVLQVKNDYVRLHSDVGGQGQVLGTLRTGTKLFYLGRADSMAYVCTEYGVRGYAYAGYLEAYSTVRMANVYYVKSSSLTVYSSASTSSSRVTTLPNGYILLLTDAYGYWGSILSLSGGVGYVQLSGLQRVAM
ncbi:MAG TPA: hypothetical protein IAA75_06240 [Candidatus Pullichristensenella avicola]|nr:hypothetical protein [Candidatus Pullichristensenella avicola]